MISAIVSYRGLKWAEITFDFYVAAELKSFALLSVTFPTIGSVLVCLVTQKGFTTGMNDKTLKELWKATEESTLHSENRSEKICKSDVMPRPNANVYFWKWTFFTRLRITFTRERQRFYLNALFVN